MKKRKWTKGEFWIQITTKKGENVSGWVSDCGIWGIRRKKKKGSDDLKYCLTHRPTGHRAVPGRTLKELKPIVDIISTWINWGSDDTETLLDRLSEEQMIALSSMAQSGNPEEILMLESERTSTEIQ